MEPEDNSFLIQHDLRARFAASEREAEEQARLNGMGAERELALRARLAVAEERLVQALQDKIAAGTEAATLRAKVVELVGALDPFAAWYFCEPPDTWALSPDDERIGEETGVSATIGDLRRAATLVEREKAQ